MADARSVAMTYGLDVIHPLWLYQCAFCHGIRAMDRVTTISRATCDALRERGVEAERIHLIPPGCDPQPFLVERNTDAFRAQYGLTGKRVILSAGRLVRRKGIDRFVSHCLPQIIAHYPDVVLLVAGGNPEGAVVHTENMADRVMEEACRAGIGEQVVITGRLSEEDLATAFQLSELFVLPAVPITGDMEGFGIVLLEAGAAHLPVVASRLGGISDAVADGESGVLVTPGDDAGLVNQICALLGNPERSRAMGQAGFERVMADFTWDKIAQRYVEALLTPH
jgi:glycosyltransferase involved in cell wall biosynthesis